MTFIYQPHVHGMDTVITPDIHIERLMVVDCSSEKTVTYPIGIDRLRTEDEIQVIGADTASVAGVVFVAARYGILMCLASDQIDLALAPASSGAARQICPKPIGRQAWRYDDVKSHFDHLILKCWADGSGVAEGIPEKPPTDLPPETASLVCGQIEPVSGSSITIELEDSVLGRKLSHRYTVRELPPNPTLA